VVDGDEDKSYMLHESYCFAGVELEIIIRSDCAGHWQTIKRSWNTVSDSESDSISANTRCANQVCEAERC
jgi:hypothetical protein